MPTINASPPRTTTRDPSIEPSLLRSDFTSGPVSSNPAAKLSSGAYFNNAFLYSIRVINKVYISTYLCVFSVFQTRGGFFVLSYSHVGTYDVPTCFNAPTDSR